MMKILVHIDSLYAGGAEKSLISFLSTLPNDKYEIDLMLLREGGLFSNMIPKHIRIVEAPLPYRCLGISPLNFKFYIKKNPILFLRKLYSLYRLKFRKELSLDQTLWRIWNSIINPFPKSYDVAISYLEGLTNYYVIDKVSAKRKIIWIHNEYSKLGYNKVFDYTFFEKADSIVTISELCRKNLINNFPSLESKIHVAENITNPDIVRSMSNEVIDDSFFECKSKDFKILSVGRLSPQKNYSLAIDAAKLLKDKGLNFKWYIIGVGPLKRELENKIRSLSLSNNVILLGLRSNPYSYMKRCDIIVQSSLFEGKSIALDEAKILYKPIVTTSYDTVYDVIEDGKTGLIADMNSSSLAEKIHQLYINKDLRLYLSSSLSKESLGNTSEIKNYIKLIDGI